MVNDIEMKPSPTLSEKIDVLYKPLKLLLNGFFKDFHWKSMTGAV